MDWLRSLLNWLGSLIPHRSSDDDGWVEPSNPITRAVLSLDELLPMYYVEPVIAAEAVAAPEPEPTPETVAEPAAAELSAPPRRKVEESDEDATEEPAAEPAAEERAA